MLLGAVCEGDLCQWSRLMKGKPHGASALSLCHSLSLSHTHTHTHTHTHMQHLLGHHLSQLFNEIMSHQSENRGIIYETNASLKCLHLRALKAT